MMKKIIIFLLLPAVSVTLYAQQIKNLKTRFTGSNIEVTYTLNTDKPVNIELQYSVDNGATYQTCHTISGDWQFQTSGNKTMTWECADDGVLDANIVFKIGIKQAEMQTAQTETETRQTERAEIEMIFVKGGIFRMGCEGNGCNPNEKPAHNVSLDNFYIGKYEVTQAQWKAIMDNNPSFFRGDDLPVENVSWNDVRAFIRSLNAKTGKKYRLPTEAEWEYAAKGGIYDMGSNVREWCYDWYGRYNKANQANPVGSLSGSERVIRGGRFSTIEKYCRNTARSFAAPQRKHHDLGFRLVLLN